MSLEPWVVALALSGAAALIVTPVAARRVRPARPGDASRRGRPGSSLGPLAGVLVSVWALGDASAPLVVGTLAAVWLWVAGYLVDRGSAPDVLRPCSLLAAAGLVVAAGLRLRVTGFEAGDAIAAIVVTFGVASAWRSSNNRDGLLIGWTVAIATAAGALGGLAGQSSLAALSAATVGASLGFLAWWFPPVEARLRTSGSLMLGFFVCVLALDADPVVVGPDAVVVPLLLVALPVVDAVLVATARVRGSRLDPRELGLVGRLGALGLPSIGVTALLVAVQAVFGGLALFVGRGVVAVPVAVVVVVLGLALVLTAALAARLAHHGRWRAPVLIAAGVVVGGVVALSVPATLAIFRARDTAGEAASATKAGLAAARNGDSVGAAAAFTEAEAKFLDAKRELADPLAAGGLAIPVLAPNFAAARDLASIGADVAGAGRLLAGEADPQRLRVRRATVPLSELRRLEPLLENAADKLRDAKRRLDDIDRTFLIGPVEDAIIDLEVRLRTAVRDSRVAADASRILPSMFGRDGPKHYFVAFQNNAETRGTGGFIGSWGILTAENGELDLGDVVRSAVLLPSSPDEARELNAPRDFKRRYSRFLPERDLRSVNLSPDAPTNAKLIADMARQTIAGPVDGVLTIDPVGLAAVMRLTGPIAVAPWPTPITADNVAAVLMRDAYVFFVNDQDAREDFLGDVVEEVWRQFKERDLGNPARVLRELGKATRTKHLTLWMADPDAQDLVEQARTDAALPPPDADLAMLTTQNAGANKTDVYLSRSLRYDVHLEPDAAGDRCLVTGTLDVTLHNSAPSSGLPTYVIGPNTDGINAGENRTFMTLYTRLPYREVTIDGAPSALQSLRELGYWANSKFLTLPSDATSTIGLQVEGVLQLEDDGTYRLRLIRQAVEAPDDVAVSIDVPQGWHLEAAKGLKIDPDGRRAHFRGSLNRDREMSVRLVPDTPSSLLDRLDVGK